MSKNTLKNLLENRLAELGCSDIPAPVRAELEQKLANQLEEAAAQLVVANVTPKRIAAAFAMHLGVGRGRNVPPPLPRA